MSQNTQQNQQQTQMQQSVPDHRFDDAMERLRVMELQNAQLRATVDHLSKQKSPVEANAAESQFKPEVLQALKDVIKQELNPFQQQFQHQVGMVYDATDEAQFRLKYSDQKFIKLLPKIDKLRQDMQMQNRWIPREEALKLVYFEETGHKAQETPAQVQQEQPVWSPYFNSFVDPKTNLPVHGVPQVAQQEQFTEQQQPAPQHPGMPWQQQQQAQQPQQPKQYQPQPTGFTPQPKPGGNMNHPYNNAHGIQLPSQGINNQAPPEHQANSQFTGLDLDSSPEQLAAFEKTFGELPL